MQRAHSALTPTFMPFRPADSDWVAYHDIAPSSGPSGLAMTWRVPGEGLKWAAAFNRTNDGWVTAMGSLGERQDVSEVVGDALRGIRRNRLLTEGQILALLFPHADRQAPLLEARGLPHPAEHAALARRAIAEADLLPGMRDAFTACLDHGAPQGLSLTSLRLRTHAGEWPALALAARHPTLVRALIECDPTMLAGDDPMAAIRRHWPAMTPAHLRRLSERGGACDLSLRALSRQATLETVHLLLSVPLDWWPRPESRKQFELCAATLRGMGAVTGKALVSLAGSSKGDWPAFAERLNRAAGLEAYDLERRDVVERARNCIDPVRALACEVMVPLVASRLDPDGMARIERAHASRSPRSDDTDPGLVAASAAAHAMLYGEKSAPAVLEMSRIWHERQAVMQADIRGRDGEREWPPLFGSEYRHGAVGVLAIRDYATLRDEGCNGPDRGGVEGLDHCVSSRLPDCLAGTAHVLSVREHAPDGTWRRLSTCQVYVAMDLGRPCLTVHEHRGERNSPPPPSAVEAVSGLSGDFLNGLVVATPQALDRSRRSSMPGGSIARACGYDWRDPEALALAVRTWDPFLPRWARGLGPDGLHDALVERELLPADENASAALPTMG